MKKVLVIAGPTASGKSDFAVEAARMLQTEIISGDSVQVYRGMDIGSGKVTKEEMQGIPHHLIDIMDPKEPYSVSDFQRNARYWIDRMELPIIVGGTGLYLKACLYDYSFQDESEESSVDPEFEQMSEEELYARLLQVDAEQAKKIHPHNVRRVMRSLTIHKRTGMRQSDLEKQQKHEPIYDVFICGCTMDREVLYERINRRVEKMFEAGLKEEVERLLQAGYTFDDPGMQGIGYREWRAYFQGNVSVEEVKELIQKNSRHYAKRQYTWLKHQMEVHWFQVQNQEERQKMLEEIRDWSQK